MERRRIIPHWLSRGVEAGLVGALLSSGTLLAFHLGRPEPRLALPQGLDGSMILVPALAAISVLALSWPIFAAATRTEALLGAIAGFLVAADLLMAVSLVARQSVEVHFLFHSLPLGVVAALLAIPPSIAGLVAGPVTSELGFGHSAGLRAVFAASLIGLLMAAIGPFVG